MFKTVKTMVEKNNKKLTFFIHLYILGNFQTYPTKKALIK